MRLAVNTSDAGGDFENRSMQSYILLVLSANGCRWELDAIQMVSRQKSRPIKLIVRDRKICRRMTRDELGAEESLDCTPDVASFCLFRFAFMLR